jgi:hypothetical protein
MMTAQEVVERAETGADAGGWLTRNRFLKVLGGGVFAAAAGAVIRAEPALAQHKPPLSPCYGFPMCHYCDGSICTQYCSWPDGHSHCPTGGQYWQTCAGITLYRCRDWHERFSPNNSIHHCLCRAVLAARC